ncbi:MAG: CDP-alcohol phosphatidyltransferase family protein [Actinobacteria bacterium]|nr:CDP-alcohol phosphatidyltransferase family protein [Actinomycetota bacterium]MSZ65660.1 CDP-alcohol phosphatidyltransferase family protein [Actinomycetota bacterium]
MVSVVEIGPTKIATLPNLITLIRLLTLPVFVTMLLVNEQRAGAALLLGVLGMTDWVDGWIARRFNQTSQFGMVFDPFVDRTLFVVGTGSVLIDGGVPLWFCVCILVREVFVGLMMAIGTLVGMKRFPVSIWGKRYTFLLMTAVPLLLLGTSTHVTADAAWLGGWFLGIPGLVMSYVVGVLYIPVVLRNVRLGRAERALP